MCLNTLTNYQVKISTESMSLEHLYYLGKCYARLGEVQKTIACYKYCLLLNGSHMGATMGMGNLMFKCGNRKLAARYY